MSHAHSSLCFRAACWFLCLWATRCLSLTWFRFDWLMLGFFAAALDFSRRGSWALVRLRSRVSTLQGREECDCGRAIHLPALIHSNFQTFLSIRTLTADRQFSCFLSPETSKNIPKATFAEAATRTSDTQNNRKRNRHRNKKERFTKHKDTVIISCPPPPPHHHHHPPRPRPRRLRLRCHRYRHICHCTVRVIIVVIVIRIIINNNLAAFEYHPNIPKPPWPAMTSASTASTTTTPKRAGLENQQMIHFLCRCRSFRSSRSHRHLL